MKTIFTLILVFINITIPALADSSDLLSYTDMTPHDGAHFEHSTPLTTLKSATQSDKKISLEMGSLHKYLAYGTLVLAGVAATTGSDSSTHHSAALGAATLAVMTAATGYYEYGDMFDMDEGLTAANAHIVLGTLGALGFAAEAAIASSGSGHGGLGIASTAAMGAACIVILW
jgi:hypothetical protein